MTSPGVPPVFGGIKKRFRPREKGFRQQPVRDLTTDDIVAVIRGIQRSVLNCYVPSKTTKHFLTNNLRTEREKMTQEVKKIVLAYSGGLDTAEMKRFSPLIDDDVYRWLDPSLCIERRNIHGGTGPETVKNALNNAKQELKT